MREVCELVIALCGRPSCVGHGIIPLGCVRVCCVVE